jgi:uncharacterized protein (DUF305 family)
MIRFPIVKGASAMPVTRSWPLVLAALSIASAAGAGGPPASTIFVDEMHQAMNRMMSGMMAPPSGDTDRDFAVMMIPHHQGAIDMAVAELRFGRDEKLRRIAQEIIVDQQQEIVAMRAVLQAPPQAHAMTMPDGSVMQ